MANNKDNQDKQKPNNNANSQSMPNERSNEANHKGATDLGVGGTKASASQQQGQGSWAAKDKNNRDGSRNSSSGGQGARNKTGEQD